MKPPPAATELKAFLPAKDFALSKQFYLDVGFTQEWSTPDDSLVCFAHGPVKFILQDFYIKEAAENIMLHLAVPDVDAWWAHLQALKLGEKYSGVCFMPPVDEPYGRTFRVIDPSGLLWHVLSPSGPAPVP